MGGQRRAVGSGRVLVVLAGVLGLACGQAAVDWLVAKPAAISQVTATADGGLLLSNGLVARRFALVPAFGTIDLSLNATLPRGGHQSMFRAVHPEGEVVLDGITYALGGLGQEETFLAYCNRSDFELEADPMAYQYVSHTVSTPKAPFPWVPGTRHSPREYEWPPSGVRLNVTLRLPVATVHAGYQVNIVYEIYDGIPLTSKWVEVRRMAASQPVRRPSMHPSSHSVRAGPSGWAAVAGNITGTADTGFCLSQSGQLNAYAYSPTPALSAALVIPTTNGGKPGVGEAQSNLGLASAMSGSNRDTWDFLFSCDDDSLYVGTNGTHPINVQSGVAPGTRISILYSTTARQASFYVNHALVATLKHTSTSASPLYPQASLASAQAPVVCSLSPSTAAPKAVAQVTSVTPELLGLMSPFGQYLTHGSLAPGSDWGGASGTTRPQPLYLAKTDQAHGAQCVWVDDFPSSKDNIPGCSGCKDEGAVEPYLNCSYQSGPGAYVDAGTDFVSFRVLGLAMDTPNLERQSLSRHRVTQLLAPHTTENPIFFHGTDSSLTGFKAAVDQMAETGFEMFIFSFGSGFNLESADPVYLEKIKTQVAYAKGKGIEVGGYDLICLDRGGSVEPSWRAVGNEGDACFASGWYDHLTSLIYDFINATGLAMLETDGPYGGESCASTSHAHHHNLEDSVYWQTRLQSGFYLEMRALNMYINQPDNFFFQGGSRTGMGYDEQQFSLPRWRDLSISRMGLYDDLYTHLPTQGWFFLPIGDYHAGGGAAAFQGHAQEYEWGLAQYLGAGTAACYRGAKPYSTDAIKGILTDWVSWYKAHRYTLIQPVHHIRRPSMQDWDGWVHVNPFALGAEQQREAGHALPKAGAEVGVALFFNPTERDLGTVHIAIPVYYCGLTTSAVVTINAGGALTVPVVDRHIAVAIPMPTRSIHRVTINRPA